MTDWPATIAVVLGVTLCLLSAVGLLRMPDVYIRLQVASKASSLGIALLMLGVALHFGELSVTVRALLVVVFLFLTAPVTAHVIGRAAYLTGTPLAPGTSPDELAGADDPETGRLAGVEGRPVCPPMPATAARLPPRGRRRRGRYPRLVGPRQWSTPGGLSLDHRASSVAMRLGIRRRRACLRWSRGHHGHAQGA